MKYKSYTGIKINWGIPRPSSKSCTDKKKSVGDIFYAITVHLISLLYIRGGFRYFLWGLFFQVKFLDSKEFPRNNNVALHTYRRWIIDLPQRPTGSLNPVLFSYPYTHGTAELFDFIVFVDIGRQGNNNNNNDDDDDDDQIILGGRFEVRTSVRNALKGSGRYGRRLPAVAHGRN